MKYILWRWPFNFICFSSLKRSKNLVLNDLLNSFPNQIIAVLFVKQIEFWYIFWLRLWNIQFLGVRITKKIRILLIRIEKCYQIMLSLIYLRNKKRLKFTELPLMQIFLIAPTFFLRNKTFATQNKCLEKWLGNI